MVLFPLGAIAACNALIGVDDLPPEAVDGSIGADSATLGPGADGAAIDATTSRDAAGGDGDDDDNDNDNDGGVMPGEAGPIPGCDGDAGSAIGDAGSADGDVMHCGPCRVVCPVPTSDFSATCVDGLCGYAGAAAKLPGFVGSENVVDVSPNGQLAIDGAHRVYLTAADSTHLDAATGHWISLDGGVTPVSGVNGLASVYLADAGAATSAVVGSNYAAPIQFTSLDGGAHGTNACPNEGEPAVSASVAASKGLAYFFDSNGVLLSLAFATGNCTPIAAGRPSDAGRRPLQSPLYIWQSTTAYSIFGDELSIWHTTGGGSPLQTALTTKGGASDSVVGAVTINGSMVFAIDGVNGGASSLGLAAADDGTVTPWSKIVVSVPGAPVITANNLAIVPDVGEGLLAIDITTGTLMWPGPANFHPSFALVGDDGLIWAVMSEAGGSNSTILGIDMATGNARFQLTGLDPINDVLLEDGRLIVQSSLDGNVVMVPVASQGYQPGSPWPVRGHDNQTHFNASSPLTY